jgi:hypothetical protein
MYTIHKVPAHDKNKTQIGTTPQRGFGLSSPGGEERSTLCIHTSKCAFQDTGILHTEKKNAAAYMFELLGSATPDHPSVLEPPGGP